MTVLGGLGNPAGALLGGIALGLVEGLATPFIPVSWIPIVEFGLFVICLIAIPARHLLVFEGVIRCGDAHFPG